MKKRMGYLKLKDYRNREGGNTVRKRFVILLQLTALLALVL